MTHSHPSGEAMFSFADLDLFFKYKFAEFRVVRRSEVAVLNFGKHNKAGKYFAFKLRSKVEQKLKAGADQNQLIAKLVKTILL